ncbi:hypothetical protein D0817_04755 [Flavobacterium cupreum]|uniref:Lipoprotein n=1 Tax=Flavobacterium cupreum TaxID=2133766 RepID=A0A434ACA6_9FLAO|nr:hypothetical protein [Flavobacterium cupreum]RUT72002.1 hypothetical protein D0817_04755 [Flavobacterium cupreum]
MKENFKRAVVVITTVLIAVLFTGCQQEDEVRGVADGIKVQAAKRWFNEYEANRPNYALFENMQYVWDKASVTRSEDGTETIIVPVTELKKDDREFWEQKMYIYKDKDKYTALLFESYSNKDVKPESQSVEGGDFTGYMTVWDLKTGPLRAAKFVNNRVVEEGVATFSNERSKTFKAPADPPCIYADFGDGGCGGLSGGDGPATPLREVIIKAPSKGTPVIYSPRSPVIGGVTPGGYTSPSGGNGGGGGSTSNNVAVYPDCASINFIKMAGLPWQEAAVRNINFKIQIIQSLTPLISSTEMIILPQAVSFQMPTNTVIGNTNITPGMAASIVAKAINAAMVETKNYYKAVPATELMVNQFFKKALKDTFELMVPGSRLQLNPISTVPPTEYKSNWIFPSNCK